MNDPLLVLCHEATRTGGARVIADLLEAAKPLIDAPLAIRLLADGPLAPRLQALSDVDPSTSRPAAILVNSALAADAVPDSGDGTPVLVYVHEEGAALAALPPSGVEALRAPGVDVLCVSESSRLALIGLGVADDRISVLRPLVVPATPPDDATVDDLRRSLGCPDGHFLVVGCGEAGWRKGADLFVELAVAAAGRERLHFAWVGRRPRGFGRRLDHDLSHVADRARVHWTGELRDVSAHLAAADVLVMTSREDPQPLVPLEAAHVGTPTIGFEIGGLRELAAERAAVAVPFPDTAAMAAALDRLRSEPALADELVRNARRRAGLQHPDVVVPRFANAVAALLDRSARRS